MAMLRCETNTPEVALLVTEAAEDKFGDGKVFGVFYEHGQWFVHVESPEDSDDEPSTWAVVDAAPGVSHGLDFEMVG